jgi:hypothetical protein
MRPRKRMKRFRSLCVDYLLKMFNQRSLARILFLDSCRRLAGTRERKTREVRLLIKRTATVCGTAKTFDIAHPAKTQQDGFSCMKGSRS